MWLRPVPGKGGGRSEAGKGGEGRSHLNLENTEYHQGKSITNEGKGIQLSPDAEYIVQHKNVMFSEI